MNLIEFQQLLAFVVMSKKRHKSYHTPDVTGMLRNVNGDSNSGAADMFDEIEGESRRSGFQRSTSSGDPFAARNVMMGDSLSTAQSDDEMCATFSACPSSMDTKSSSCLNNYIAGIMRSNVSAVIAGRLNYPWKANLFEQHYEPFPKTGLEDLASLPGFANSFKAVDDKSEEVIPAQTEMRMRTGAVLLAVKKRLHVVPWPKQEAAKRDLALRRWRLIVEENIESTRLGRQMSELGNELASDDEIRSVITDTFARKATSTLAKRSGPLLKFLIWHRREFGFSGMPPSEAKAYKYVKFLQRTKFASTPRAFLSSVTFAQHILSMNGASEISDSERVRGACHNKLLEKRPLKQRRKFTVDEVKSLHQLSKASPCNYDRYASSFFLAQTYTRGRYTGFCASEKLIPDFDENDEGFLEAPTLMSKTQTSADKKRTFLPQVAPAVGIITGNWARQFIEERKAQKIDHFRWLLPTPCASGGWIDEPLSVSEASKWLKALLRQMGHTNLDDVGTHTCKLTLLAWCASFGVPLDIRTLLGYHIPQHNMSAITYSRDAQALPLRHLCEVLQAVREGRFQPDVTRSGRFKRIDADNNADDAPSMINSNSHAEGTATPGGHSDEEEKDEHDLSSDSGSSSESSSSSDEDLDHVAANTLSKVRVPVPEDVSGMTAYFHPITMILHCKDDADNRFKCRRVLSSTYRKVQWHMTSPYSNCFQCFGASKP